MDDISFFDSSEYEHRGGVWADAVRLDKPVAAPASDANVKPTQPSEEAGLSHVHSEEASLDNIPITRSTTSSTEKTSTTTRRSWFYSGADFEPDINDHVKEVEARGRKERTPEPDGSLAPSLEASATLTLDASDNDQDALSLRSLSQHSQTCSRSSRAHSLSSSVGGDESSNYLSDTSPSLKNARHSLGTSTASSFLSTLKSKAGDKQALSNTAKEAMRKWGVNWGLKKESGAEDLLEVGPSDHRPRTESTHGRQSYADMRAAVIERRERDHLDGSTSPIPIPTGGGQNTNSRATSYSNGSTSPGLSRSLGDDPFKDRDDAEEDVAPSLIHTQPSQARTMTIPGIHASHRGEVMSMGNVAPSLPAPDAKLKGPTIQSMYRLWKSPILTGQPSEGAQSSSSGCGDVDMNPDVAPLSLAPEVITPPPRAVPPPLPPRTISSVAVRHATENPDELLVSAASEALKSIASKDETRRLSIEGEGEPEVTVPSKPPLPPRRVVT